MPNIWQNKLIQRFRRGSLIWPGPNLLDNSNRGKIPGDIYSLHLPGSSDQDTEWIQYNLSIHSNRFPHFFQLRSRFVLTEFAAYFSAMAPCIIT